VCPTRPITSVLDQLCVAEEAIPGSGRTQDAEATEGAEVKRSASLGTRAFKRYWNQDSARLH
jgi:hypothetical protein